MHNHATADIRLALNTKARAYARAFVSPFRGLRTVLVYTNAYAALMFT